MKCNHSILNDKCKECQRLQKDWYQKLRKETDFKELESITYEDRPLKSWSQNVFGTMTSDEVEIVRNKFEQAREFLNTHSFENETQKRIWELHCDGLSLREIQNRIDRFYSHQAIKLIIIELEREFTW